CQVWQQHGQRGKFGQTRTASQGSRTSRKRGQRAIRASASLQRSPVDIMTTRTTASTDLFRHVTADKAALYRTIMDVFAAAKRQYRLQLRPDEVLAEGRWEQTRPAREELGQALNQLAEWGNLESQPDMARVATLN